MGRGTRFGPLRVWGGSATAAGTVGGTCSMTGAIGRPRLDIAELEPGLVTSNWGNKSPADRVDNRTTAELLVGVWVNGHEDG